MALSVWMFFVSLVLRKHTCTISPGPSCKSPGRREYALLLGNLVLNVRRIGTAGLGLGELDLQHLHLAGELQDLVLDLAVLERVGGSAGRSVDRGVELIGLGSLGGLAHRLDVLRDGGVERGEVDAREGVDEDRVRLLVRAARDAVRDLEGGVAVARLRPVSTVASEH